MQSLEVSGKAVTASLATFGLEHEWLNAVRAQEHFINDVLNQISKQSPKDEKVITMAKEDLDK